jgi:hypothetical protein
MPAVNLKEPALQFAAPIEFGAEGDALPQKFNGTAYSGGLVPGLGVVIDMESTTFRPKLPLLADHNRTLIVGVIDSPHNDSTRMTVAGRLFSDMPGTQAERIAMLAARGAPFEMSVGLYDFKVEMVGKGKTVSVNGREFEGPITVLRNGVVREVSVVTLGADPNTDSQFFHLPSGTPEGASSMELEELRAEVARLTAEAAKTPELLAAARAEGAEAERKRIQSVEAALIPGHEALIASLKFDGKTNGGEAALAVNAAERQLRLSAAAAFAADAPQPAAPAATPAVDPPAPQADMSLPVEARAKDQWEKNAGLHREFSTLGAYTAFLRAEEAGRARILKK